MDKRKKKELALKLTPEQYNICYLKGTEPPFSGKYTNNHETGVYVCAVCGKSLFASDTKYDSGTGWPSFWDFAKKGVIKMEVDKSMGMVRTEVLCANCEAHLGHVFDDGSKDKGGRRYCINSLALEFVTKK